MFELYIYSGTEINDDQDEEGTDSDDDDYSTGSGTSDSEDSSASDEDSEDSSSTGSQTFKGFTRFQKSGQGLPDCPEIRQGIWPECQANQPNT